MHLLPSAAAGHQEVNARVFERAGAARVLLQRDLQPEGLASVLEDLLLGPGRPELSRMSAALGALRLPDPSRVADALADLVEGLGKTVS